MLLYKRQKHAADANDCDNGAIGDALSPAGGPELAEPSHQPEPGLLHDTDDGVVQLVFMANCVGRPSSDNFSPFGTFCASASN